MKTCPYCAEDIPPSAKSCPYCRSKLAGASRSPRGSSRSSVSPWVIVGAVAGGMMLLVIPCLLALLLPAIQQAREAARMSQCKNNLKQIGLALHNYHDVYRTFPPAYVADEDGRPMHSWRVLILPYLEYGHLYDAYDFSQPWDSPANRHVLDNMPPVFACPSHSAKSTHTHYAAVSGPDTVFEGAAGIAIREITDGTSNTMMIGEASNAMIPWTSPRDVDVSLNPNLGDPNGFSAAHPRGVHFLAADGAVHLFSLDMFPDTLKKLYTRNDGQAVAW